MIEAKADPKPDEKADDLGPGVEPMDPCVSVKVKKKVHKTPSLQDANCRINAAMDMLPSKASEGDFIRNGLVSEDFTLSEFLFRRGMIVPNRLKVRLEAFPKSIPMSVWTRIYAIPVLHLKIRGKIHIL